MNAEIQPLALNTQGIEPCPADPNTRTVRLGHDVAHLAIRAERRAPPD